MTTLSLDYTLPAGTRPGRRGRRTAGCDGDNVGGASLRRLGYDFVHATRLRRATPARGCEDMCVDPKRRAATGRHGGARVPRGHAAGAGAAGRAEGRRRAARACSTPDGIVRRGRRTAATAGRCSSTRHLMTPHPPYRVRRPTARCARAFDGDLDAWGDPRGAGGRRSRDTVRCTEPPRCCARPTRITRHDPDALDLHPGRPRHGVRPRLPRHAAAARGPARDSAQRYAILSAARLPERCADRARAGDAGQHVPPRAGVRHRRGACRRSRRGSSRSGYEDGDRVEALPRAGCVTSGPGG